MFDSPTRFFTFSLVLVTTLSVFNGILFTIVLCAFSLIYSGKLAKDVGKDAQDENRLLMKEHLRSNGLLGFKFGLLSLFFGLLLLMVGQSHYLPPIASYILSGVLSIILVSFLVIQIINMRRIVKSLAPFCSLLIFFKFPFQLVALGFKLLFKGAKSGS